MRKIIFTEQQTKEIIELYTIQNFAMKKIGDRFGVSKNVISRILQENNIDRTPRRKYQANYDIFENIDSKEKAYWLGFIAADGCVYQRPENASLIININSRDKEQLKAFKIFMNTNAIIYDYETSEGFSNNTSMSKIVLNSKKMVQDLIDKNITPRKSLTLQPPNIDSAFYLSFIAGYFDGDGSIYETKQKEFGISFVGTEEILTWIAKVLNWDVKLEKKNNDNKNNYYIRCGGTKKPYAIIKQFYEQSPQHLTRKFEKYKKLETVVLARNC